MNIFACVIMWNKKQSLKYIWICTLSHCMIRIWLLFLGTSDWKDLQDSITQKKQHWIHKLNPTSRKWKIILSFQENYSVCWRRLISKQNGLMIQELCAFLPTKMSQKNKRVSMVFQAFCAAFKTVVTWLLNGDPWNNIPVVWDLNRGYP